VRVGVETPIDKHLLQRATQQRVGQSGPVEPHVLDRVALAHTGAVQPIHDQDPCGRQLPVDDRDMDLVVAGQAGGNLGGVAGLLAEVELLAEPLRELTGQLGHVVLRTPGGTSLDRPGERGED